MKCHLFHEALLDFSRGKQPLPPTPAPMSPLLDSPFALSKPHRLPSLSPFSLSKALRSQPLSPQPVDAQETLVREHGKVEASGCRAPTLENCPTRSSAPGLQNTGSVVVAHGLGCSTARGILPDQESKPTSPTLAGRLPTTEPPGKPEGTLHSEFLLVCFF